MTKRTRGPLVSGISRQTVATSTEDLVPRRDSLKFGLIGLNHRNTPVEFRERIAFAPDELVTALKELRGRFGLREGMILSTCNRVEIVGHARQTSHVLEKMESFIALYHKIARSDLQPYLYSLREAEVVRHLFRLASGLDSMVVGESQILSQLKQAYQSAVQAGSIGNQFNRLLPRAFFVAKRVRTETGIASSAISISSVAVELARKIFGDLAGKSALLLGAGKMGELALRNLVSSGVSQVLVGNRSLSRAQRLASQFNGVATSLQDLKDHLIRCDIVLASTGSKTFVVSKDQVQAVVRQRKYRPLFIIDIAVPRNVDPQVNSIDNVFLFDIDDLQSVVDSNLEGREREAEIAEYIVDEEVKNYLRRSAFEDAGPLISALRQRMEEICLADLKNNSNDLDPAEYERLEKLLRRAARKVAHPLIEQIKNPSQGTERRENLLDSLARAFRLKDET